MFVCLFLSMTSFTLELSSRNITVISKYKVVRYPIICLSSAVTFFSQCSSMQLWEIRSPFCCSLEAMFLIYAAFQRMLSHPRKCRESFTCCIPDSSDIAKIAPLSIEIMYVIFFMIDGKLEYHLITSYCSQLTNNYKLTEKFLSDSCTSSL